QMVLDALPRMAQPYADALGSIDDITVIDRDGSSRLTDQVAVGVQELGARLKAQTGVDLLEMVRGRAAGEARPENAAPAGQARAQDVTPAGPDRPERVPPAGSPAGGDETEAGSPA